MYRAIVIDDEKWTLMGICRTFHWEEEGFEQPFSTTDPEEGLAQILAAPPDAVFVDIRMPEMTGLELMATARQNGVASEFVIISGLQDFENARTAMKYAAFDYLLKPLDQETAQQLLHKLHLHLDSQNGSARLSAPVEEVHRRLLETSSGDRSEAPEDAFSRMVRYVEEHLDEPLLLKNISAHFFLTPNYVSSLFRERLNTTYSEYLNSLRVAKAMRLLRHTQRSVEDIAQNCGYSDGRYFSRVFHKQTGVSPLQYRKG